MQQPSILVIDDNPENFEVIEILLSNATEDISSNNSPSLDTAAKDQKQPNYRLQYAANGQEALNSLDVFKPDLILLDVMMPGIDGIEVCRQIKAMPKWQSVPIIMVTVLTAKSTLAECLRAGADDFISKPVNALELRARVGSMLRIKRQHDRLKQLAQRIKKQRNYIRSVSKLQHSSITLLTNSLQTLRQGLATNLTQELNSPLRGLLAILTMLQVQFNDMSPSELRQSINQASQSAHQLETLLQQILFYLYLESKAAQKSNVSLLLETSKQQYSTQQLISQIAKTRAARAQRSEDLILELQEAHLSITKQYLSLIVGALIDNALKFSPSRTPIMVRSNVEENMFYLWVRDCGRGMTQQQIASIGAFTQFERQVSGKQGLGLGLTLSKKIVYLYHGRLIISSTPDKGTTVQVILPINHKAVVK
ncbi:hybrid sensor histidine kinase/response regulator [Leptolyngbya cf. ectocarpi LEGE 11479]|uniref:histidine kinase n=1 Tax=Leptolyngbya cf. ectocarpi LEGE 11479 TaxID=1828722 RepID=A0A928ZXC8_LEPEC|nr:hybrid sensor histidine kinase/response regulator [Leptolyngbya ectocarpi]MBE9069244.1 hybrid sensor histidine kinase/response regulator [Leptolyngbya cf. ectocarpi LEGE 11479]